MTLRAEQNPGWKYIRLPQSMYLTSPEGCRFYFGYADPRFKYFDQGLTFREIVTYSFLDCGEFHQDINSNVWRNHNFAIPGAILDMLIETKPEDRAESFMIWKNVYSRNPELINKISSLKTIRSFTRDGMYIYTPEIIPDELIGLLRAQGFNYFCAGGKIPQFEDMLESLDLPTTRVFRKSLLSVLIKGTRIDIQLFGWVKLFLELFGLDRTQNALQETPEQFNRWSKNCALLEDGVLNEKAFDNLKKFFNGLSIDQFYKVVDCDADEPALFLFKSVSGQLDSFTKYFSLDPKSEDPPHLWTFMRNYKIPFEYVGTVFSNPEKAESLFKPIISNIPVLYKDKTYLIRSPINGMEVIYWGHKLKNCLRYRMYLSNAAYWLFGVYEGDNLIAALQVTDSYEISQFLAFGNQPLPAAQHDALLKIIRKQLSKYNPLTKLRLELLKKFKKFENETLTEAIYQDMLRTIREQVEVLVEKGALRVPKRPEQLLYTLKEDIEGLRYYLAQRS